MPTLTIPNAFTGATTILSSAVNANNDAIVAWSSTIDQTNFGNMTGVVTWAVVSNVLAQSISTSSTEGGATWTFTGVFASAKSGMKLTSAANQTTGDALLYGNLSSASSTIPTALFNQAGTGKVLKVTSTTGPSVPAPVMTTAQKAAITGAAGDQVYDSTIKRPEFYDGVAWRGHGTVLNVVSKTTTYTATGADDLILCSTAGGAWTLTLPAAASHPGKVLRIKKTTNDFSVLTIATNSTETIDGVDGTTVDTQYEELAIVSDASNWHTISRRIPSDTNAVTMTGAWSANSTYTSKMQRVGDWAHFHVYIALSGDPDSGGAAIPLSINLPTGLTIDTAKLSNGANTDSIRGSGIASDTGSNLYPIVPRYSSTSAVAVHITDDGTGTVFAGQLSSASPANFGNTDYISIYFSVPISGWKG